MRATALALSLSILVTAGPVGRAGRTSEPSGAGGDAHVDVLVAQDFSPAVSASSVRIGVLRGSAYEVVSVPLEEYVARVLTGEALPGSAPAAMDALAIAIRTYTQANLGRHRADGFDLCDQTHCQVMRNASAATERAAQATRGKVLLYHGIPATIFYSASCGGRTEVPSAVWPGAEDPPYLPSRPDDGCGGDPVWTAELALPDLQRSLMEAGFRGRLRSVSIASRNSSGRVAKLSLEGLTPSEISGQDLRAAVGRTLGWQHIRSTAFELRRIGAIYRMDGRGSGHGVGMCVIGSAKLATAGASAGAILARYFPGLDLGAFMPAAPAAPVLPPAVPAPLPPAAPVPLPPPARTTSTASSRTAAGAPTISATADGVVVSLPEGDEGEREAMTRLAVLERDLLAKTLGVIPPSRLTVRFHPTTDDYARATGRAWFTSGAVVSAEIHLPPLAALRDRGVLERMLRRQVVHLMIDDVLSRRPAWVREGAALFFADGLTTPGTLSRTSCPTDVELLKPVSPGSLGTAYAQARACFERQIAAGRNWRDVR